MVLFILTDYAFRRDEASGFAQQSAHGFMFQVLSERTTSVIDDIKAEASLQNVASLAEALPACAFDASSAKFAW